MTIKTASVWPVNASGEIVVQAGTGSTTVTGFLSQDQVPTDDSTNKVVFKLPDLDAIVLAEPITGFVAGSGTVGATDTILQAFNKIVGNIALKATDLLTGYVSGAGTVAATDTVLQAVQKLNGNIALKALNLLTGFTSGAGTVAGTDTVLQGIQKLDGNVTLKANAADAALTGNTSTQAVTKNTRVVIAAGDITVSATDHIIVVKKTSGAATAVNLPAGVLGREIIVKDGKADASSNNITVTPAAGNIDGSSTLVMNADRQSVTLVYSGTEWAVI